MCAVPSKPPTSATFRFSLRAALIGVAIIAMLLGVYGWRLDRERRIAFAEAKAAEALQAAGAIVTWRAAPPSPWDWVRPYVVEGVDLGDLNADATLDPATDRGRIDFGDDDARWIAACPGVVLVRLSCTRVGDRSIEWLAGLKSLNELDLSKTRITGAALDPLARLPALRELDVRQTRVTLDDTTRLHDLRPSLLISH